MDIVEATNEAIEAAEHLTDADTGAVQALRDLAVKIAVAAEYFDALYDEAIVLGRKAPSQDNVSIPTYLKYCESLGLTPAGRAKLVEKKPEEAGDRLAAVRNLRDQPKKKRGKPA